MMAKHDATGRTKVKDPHHVRLYDWFTATKAWRALSPAERCVYIELEARFFGGNNGSIALGVRGAAKACNISTGTAAKSLKRLVEVGFTDCMTRGGFSQNGCKAAEWRLTRAPCDVTRERPSKRFMAWSPPITGKTKRSIKSETVSYQTEDSRGLKCA